MSESQEQAVVETQTTVSAESVKNVSDKTMSESISTNARVIKKYQNRKLYDTTDSYYITFKDILEFVLKGEEVLILENTTKKDITDSAILSSLSEYTKDLSSNEICNILAVVGKFIKERGERNGL
jgi:hypothetical protein